MAGTRIPIQFRRERQTHAAPGAQVRDLLIGKRFDGAGLHSGVGGLSDRRSECEHQGGDGERNKLLHGGDLPTTRPGFGDLSRKLLGALVGCLTAGISPPTRLHYPREAVSRVRSHISPGPYRSFRELSLARSVDLATWCPPTFVGNSGIECSNGHRGFALLFLLVIAAKQSSFVGWTKRSVPTTASPNTFCWARRK